MADKGITPLLCTSNNGNLQLVQALLTKLETIHPDMKQRCLDITLKKGHSEVFKALLSKEDLANKEFLGNYLIKASELNDIKVVKFLLKHGASVSTKDQKGDTALHKATTNSHIAIMRELLKFGASPTTKNVNERTPLGIAHERGDIIIYNMLKLKHEYSSSPKKVSESQSFSVDISRFSTVYKRLSGGSSSEESDKRRAKSV